MSGFALVSVAHTGAAALRMIDELRPDLMLLDIYMPDIDGLTALRGIRESAEATDVMVISAADDVDTVRAAVRGGVLHYLISRSAMARSTTTCGISPHYTPSSVCCRGPRSRM
jgi:response regulator of citrate/malate metabolism